VGNAEHTFEINESCVKTSNGSYSGIFLVQKTNTKLKTTNNQGQFLTPDSKTFFEMQSLQISVSRKKMGFLPLSVFRDARELIFNQGHQRPMARVTAR